MKFICTKCKLEKEEGEFEKRKDSPLGRRMQCRDCHSSVRLAYRIKNREEIRRKDKIIYNRDKEKIIARKTKKFNEDLSTKIKHYLRTRLRSALKRNSKTGSAVKALGCTIEEFKVYFESKFQPGMTWDNHGEWHIDHIKPLSSFDLTNPEEIKKCCHYTNLQPLWAIDNLVKGTKII